MNANIFTEYWKEITALLLDGIVFGIASSLYASYKTIHSRLEESRKIGINPDFELLKTSEKSCVIVHGVAKPVQDPIRSYNVPDAYGVIQKFTIKNHAIARSAAGFWTNEKHTIRETFQSVPFVLEKGSYVVSVENALNASFLELDTIVDRFEPAKSSFFDAIFVLFTGVRQQGIQTTEEMLKVGTFLTGVGELTVDLEGQLVLRQPSDGSSPFILTVLPITSLLKKLDEISRFYWWLSLTTGTIGLLIFSSIFKKAWKHYRRKQEEMKIKERLEFSRRKRRQNERSLSDLSDSERCVVCQFNPKEIFILPCGHVCMCEDCSCKVTEFCPICRSIIEKKHPAFIS